MSKQLWNNERVVNALMMKKHVSDQVIWEALWDTDEDAARQYVRERWYADRTITQNFITRKLKRFWPQVSEAKSRHREVIRNDESQLKVYFCSSSRVVGSTVLGYVAAGSEAEAQRLFDTFLPPSSAEEEVRRSVYLEAIVPQSHIPSYLASRNADSLGSLMARIRREEEVRDEAVEKHNKRIQMYSDRLASLQIFLSSTTPQEEKSNENTEVHDQE